MISLLTEFDSELAGVAVFADNAQEDREQQFDYKSLLKVTNIDVKNQQIEVEVGNIFNTEKEEITLNTKVGTVVPAFLCQSM